MPSHDLGALEDENPPWKMESVWLSPVPKAKMMIVVIHSAALYFNVLHNHQFPGEVAILFRTQAAIQSFGDQLNSAIDSKLPFAHLCSC